MRYGLQAHFFRRPVSFLQKKRCSMKNTSAFRFRTVALLTFFLFLSVGMIAAGLVLVLRREKGPEGPWSVTAEKGTDPTGTAGEEESHMKNDEKPAPAAAARVIPGDPASLTGTVRIETVTAATGTLSEEYPVWTFRQKGDAVEWEMDLSSPVPENGCDPILLAVTEIHQENEETLAYRVFVDGELTYFRTYEQLASAPNRYYIFVDRAAVRDLRQVCVRIESEGKTAFSIASVTAYTDLFGAAAREKADTRLQIYLHSAASLDKAKGHIADFDGYEYRLYDIGLLFKLDYLNLTVSAASDQLAAYLALAAQKDMPLQIMPTIYWGQPNIPDGRGGFFTDARYQQVSYNSLDGKYYGTNPNVYSSTTWVTSGNATLNGACSEKIKAIFPRFAGLLHLYRAERGYKQTVSIVMEHGVCYKAMTSGTGVQHNETDGGDFNPAILALAAADGVALDPENGLSREEKSWMIRHHADYNQALADAYHEALGSEAVLVSAKGSVYPTDALTDHILTHGVQWTERHPAYGDQLISGWKSGVGRGMYSSSEDMFWDDVRFYQYKASYGRVGTVNFEVSYSKSGDLTDLLRKAYELGFEYLTLFNDASEYRTADLIAAMDDIDGEIGTYTVNHYDRMLLNADFNRDAAAADIAGRYGITSWEGLTYDRENGVLKVADGCGSGYAVFTVSDGGDVFENGLRIRLESRANGGSVTVCGGRDGAFGIIGSAGVGKSMNYVNPFVQSGFDISGETQGLTSYAVRIELTGQASLKALAVYGRFGLISGQQNGFRPTRAQYRLLNLTTQWERLAENRLAEYREKTGEADDPVCGTAVGLMADGQYREACRRLNQAIAAALPATFTVSGEGRLGTLPITVSVGGYVGQVTVHSLRNDYAEMSFLTTYAFNEKGRRLTVTVGDLLDGRYRLTQIAAQSGEDNRWILRQDEAGDLTAENGTLTFAVTVRYEAERPPQTVVFGRFLSRDGRTLRVVVQDASLSGWSRFAEFRMAADAVILRGAEGEEPAEGGTPAVGDGVTLFFDESGETVTKAVFAFGTVTGRVERYEAPDYTDPETHNGVIVMEDGRRFEFDYLDTTTAFTQESVTRNVRTYTDGELAELLVGREVTVTYTPETDPAFADRYPRILKLNVRSLQ